MIRCDICAALATARPLVRKAWRLYPDYAMHRGRRVSLAPQEARVLYVLAKAGTCVPAWTLGLRISGKRDPDGSPVDVAKSAVRRVRMKLACPPFESVRGAGYRWAA